MSFLEGTNEGIDGWAHKNAPNKEMQRNSLISCAVRDGLFKNF